MGWGARGHGRTGKDTCQLPGPPGAEARERPGPGVGRNPGRQDTTRCAGRVRATGQALGRPLWGPSLPASPVRHLTSSRRPQAGWLHGARRAQWRTPQPSGGGRASCCSPQPPADTPQLHAPPPLGPCQEDLTVCRTQALPSGHTVLA